MIWLSGQGGIQPVGGAIQSSISLAGHTWTLWSGPNQNWNVFSFVSANGDITNFSADLKVFFDFLVSQHGVSSSMFVQSVQSGTEPFTGSADLMIGSYSLSAS
jgi:xyloglucan-specific endo-beta-1,4-glucanase